MESDSRQVGYADPWVRPPVEVYHLVPNTNNDGVDASYRMSAGSAINTMQVTAGRSIASRPGGGTGRLQEVVLLSDTLEQDS